MEINEMLAAIRSDLADMKQSLMSACKTNLPGNWLPRNQVMQYLNYGPTQMTALENSGEIIVSKVGKRKFILKDSIEKWLERNIQKHPASGDSMHANG